MKNAAWIFLTAGISFLLWATPDPPENAALRALVDSEIAFARQAATEGIRPAFLHYLAEAAVVFRPTPEPGRKSYAESSAVPGILTWRPEFATSQAPAIWDTRQGRMSSRRIQGIRNHPPLDITSPFGESREMDSGG